MELFVDCGLFELLGLLTLARVLHDSRARRRMRQALRSAPAKLGRCWRCMAGAALGLIMFWGALVWIPPHADWLLRVLLWCGALAFTSLAALHALTALYRILDRLERRVSVLAGGCGCNQPQGPIKASE